MERDDAVSMVNVVCWRLGLRPVDVHWSQRAKRGRYYSAEPRRRAYIISGPRCWRGTGASLVHELAHHVVADRAPRYSQRERSYRGMIPKRIVLRAKGWGEAGIRLEAGVHHGPVFVEALREVAALWYGDVDLYPWNTEYKSLRARARE